MPARLRRAQVHCAIAPHSQFAEERFTLRRLRLSDFTEVRSVLEPAQSPRRQRDVFFQRSSRETRELVHGIQSHPVMNGARSILPSEPCSSFVGPGSVQTIFMDAPFVGHESGLFRAMGMAEPLLAGSTYSGGRSGARQFGPASVLDRLGARPCSARAPRDRGYFSSFAGGVCDS